MFFFAGHLLFRRVSRLVLGVSLGVAAVLVVYLITQREQQEDEVQSEGKPLAPRPDHNIVIPPPVKVQEIQPVVLPLSVRAEPMHFIRREPGTIHTETLPGATCAIEAIYSTKRRPTSLDTSPIVVDQDGECQWTWGVGTSGTHVDVTVWAWLEGYEQAEAKLRVNIED